MARLGDMLAELGNFALRLFHGRRDRPAREKIQSASEIWEKIFTAKHDAPRRLD